MPDQCAGRVLPCFMRFHRWAGLFVLLAVASFFVDLPIALFCARHDSLPGDLRKLVMLSEAFAHGSGVALILVAAFVLDPMQRRKMVRVAVCAFASGLTVDLMKLLVGRVRPHSFDLNATVWNSFDSWLPVLFGTTGADWDSTFQSFPSGHAATAVGFAIGLGWLYPRGRWLFAGLATLGCLQRLLAQDHYLSDVLMGTAVAFCVAGWSLDSRRLGRWFDRLEKEPAIERERPHARAA